MNNVSKFISGVLASLRARRSLFMFLSAKGSLAVLIEKMYGKFESGILINLLLAIFSQNGEQAGVSSGMKVTECKDHNITTW